MEAARAGDFHRVEQLVTAGAELNVADSCGETLLEAIITQLHPGYPGAGIEQVEMVSLLLNLGADPNFLGQSGPLTLPMLAMDVPMLSVMLAAGADPNLPYGSRDDGTLYDWAAYDYVLEIWEYPYEFTGSPIYDLDAENFATEDARLKRVDDMAVQYGVRRPDHLFLLRRHGAKSRLELTESEFWNPTGISCALEEGGSIQAGLPGKPVQPGLADAIQLLTSVIRQEGDLSAPGLADRLINVHEQFGGLPEVADLFENAADAYCKHAVSRAVAFINSPPPKPR